MSKSKEAWFKKKIIDLVKQMTPQEESQHTVGCHGSNFNVLQSQRDADPDQDILICPLNNKAMLNEQAPHTLGDGPC